MQGRACIKTKLIDCTKYKQLANIHVFRFLGIADLEIELMMQRIKWYQSIAQFTDQFEQFITAVFGDLSWNGQSTLEHPWKNNYMKT